ncbi:sialate O-acetylesterase [Lutibacter citreus]|uniref:sialate O-acetylesterase n=1 Tax=Lutibacter citreus TaxID=2138210 RepID=UPI0021D28888|nr:sialate O-acetylesterase [Lutibacter citreus]
MLGEVWFASGQSNMTMLVKGGFNQPLSGSNDAILHSNNRRIRMWTSDLVTANKPNDNIGGSWEVANVKNTPNFSAVGYFFAEKLERVLDVPVGIVLSGWGGTPIESWMDKESLESYPEYSYHTNSDTLRFRQPSVLWNSMIHPFLGLKVKGMLWYQGESNWEHPFEYAELFPKMINTWRNQWGDGDIPFYYVQVSPKDRSDVNTAFLLEAQEKTMDVTKHTGMVVIHDIGECWQIHPREKQTIGKRLAYWAFSKDYGIENIGYQSPRYKSMTEDAEGRLLLDFEADAGGLSTFDKELTGFQVAGSDRIFYNAKAHIKWNTSKVIVWSEKVKKPIAASYLFDDCGETTLFSGAGLPVGSFRTDDWPDEILYK